MNKQAALVALAGACVSVSAQTDPLRFDHVGMLVDSGEVSLPAGGLAYSGVIETPGADWIRLWFGQTTLPPGAELFVTSATTGDTQRLNATTLEQWANSSAYFVGDAVYVDLVLPAGASGRVVVTGADMGLPPLDARSICDSVDDRVLSNDPRANRLAPQGCTAWMFNNRPNTAATAQHCGAASGNTLWFNVPLRTSTGGTVPPHPDDQYPVDGASLQGSGGASIGNDWTIFGVFNNSNTGLSPIDAMKASYVLATSAPTGDNRPITITGYGTTSSPIPAAWSGVQKTHTGPYFSESGTTIRYRTDTTGGNSGSAVVDETAQRVIGIHTNGGCGTGSTSSNSGTSVENSGFRTGAMTARGVNAGPIPAVIRPIGAMPERIDPAGLTAISAELVADFTGPAPTPGVTLHSNDGSGWVATEMSPGFASDWITTFPPTDCGSTVRYYFSAEGSTGTTVTFPPSAPAVAFEAVSSDEWTIIAESDAQADDGWTVSNNSGVTGGWQRGVPPATDTRGGPRSDADGSGACWTTGVTINVDLDGSATQLSSPVIDLSAANDPWVDLSVWLNADGSTDRLAVEFSGDGGAAWSLVESVGSTPGWRPVSYRVADFVALTSAFQIRVTATDLGADNVVEAGVDAMRVRDVACGSAACSAADVAAPFGVLDLADVQGFVAAFLDADPVADLAAPFGVFDLSDVQAFVAAFSKGCP